ncbi:MAG: sugar transferase [Lachnospiraceae bacterium]|nr:sugar transferase [Lachnospiraceae bacterium]MBQ9562430.1 sugar transferase [Lachnospiraceae bacterium]MBQ9593236.1 sugar transferase [Lachnospiraceae bacterium]MBR0153835.1 sugar transferase [Lachnospiraceae bacterium]
MKLRRWEELPAFLQNEEVRPYYDSLVKKQGLLTLKRAFDVTVAWILLVLLALPMAAVAIWIKLDSPGPVFYRQERVTQYGKRFKIHKFRTMVDHADQIGSAVTVGGDPRITRVGAKLRHLRIDELPQLIDVLQGTMSFVGTRPEAVKYVKKYKPEYRATLLLPAGITSETSIRYKDESRLLKEAEDVDLVYVRDVLPGKMEWNLKGIREMSAFGDLKIMFETVFAVLKH